MEHFDDLMGITHHTGDAWLDKKLNQNTAYIGFLGSMALGAVGSKLFGGSKAPKGYGGGFDPAIRPQAIEAVKDIQAGYQDPRYFEGPRVAAFDPAQLQAQTSLLALSTADPDYFRRAETGLEEAIGLQRMAAAPITAEAIQAQREVLAPVAEAERMAARRALQESVRDIGIATAGAGEGAYTGGRADVLRGTAVGEFAQTEADIQSRLTQQAIEQERASRAAQAAGAAGLSTLFGEQLGVAKGQTAADIARAELAAGVGAERRDLAQARIGEQREIFQEQDPFTRAQQYLAAISGAPTRQEQFYQPKSTLQEAAGLASIFSGMGGFAQGGGIAQAAGMSKAAFDALDADIEEADRINAVEDAANLMERGGVQSALADLAKGDLQPQEKDQEYFRKQAAAQSKLRQMLNQPKTAYRQTGSVIASGDPRTSGFLSSIAGVDKKEVETAKKSVRKALASGQIDQQEYDRQMSYLEQRKPKQDPRISNIETIESKDPTVVDKARSLGRSFLASLGGARANPFAGMTDAEVMDVQMRAITPAEQSAAQRELQSRQAARPTGAQIRAAQAKAQPKTTAASTVAPASTVTTTPAARPVPASVRAMDSRMRDRLNANQQQQQQQQQQQGNQEDSLMDRILGGVRSGLQSISSANLDPFKGYTDKERVRIGLGILGAMPEIGEGPLGPIGRGALLAIEDLPEAEEITPRVAPVPSSEYAVIDEGILGLQKTKTKMGAERRNQLRRESEQEVIQAIRAGQVANDPASFRTAVLANYERKVRAETGVKSSNAAAGRAGAAGKGSTSAGLKAITS